MTLSQWLFPYWSTRRRILLTICEVAKVPTRWWWTNDRILREVETKVGEDWFERMCTGRL